MAYPNPSRQIIRPSPFTSPRLMRNSAGQVVPVPPSTPAALSTDSSGGSDIASPGVPSPSPMLQPSQMASPLNPSSIFMGPGRFGPQNNIPGLGTGGLQTYDPRAAAQAAVAAALAQQAANPWKPPAQTGMPRMGSFNRMNPFRGGGSAADPNPDTVDRPFSDLGGFLGAAFGRTPFGMAFNAITGSGRKAGGSNSGGGGRSDAEKESRAEHGRNMRGV